MFGIKNIFQVEKLIFILEFYYFDLYHQEKAFMTVLNDCIQSKLNFNDLRSLVNILRNHVLKIHLFE